MGTIKNNWGIHYCRFLKPGDQVALNSGPFANFVAEVEKIVLDRRVWMLMEIMLAMTSPTVALDL
jgi:transcriptional antiterminator RfaH